MQRQKHIDELPDENRVARIVAAFVVAAIVAGGTGFLMYGSGLWQPQVHQTEQ